MEMPTTESGYYFIIAGNKKIDELIGEGEPIPYNLSSSNTSPERTGPNLPELQVNQKIRIQFNDHFRQYIDDIAEVVKLLNTLGSHWVVIDKEVKFTFMGGRNFVDTFYFIKEIEY